MAPRAYSPAALAAALTRAGLSTTKRTVNNWIGRGDLPARRDARGRWRIGAAVVKARWPSLFVALARAA